MRTRTGILGSAVATLVGVAVGQSALAVKTEDFDLVQTMKIDVPPQDWATLRVDRDGSIYVLDRGAGRVFALSPAGAKRWETPATNAGPETITHFDLAEDGSLRVLKAGGEMATADRRGRMTSGPSLRDHSDMAFGSAVDDGEGGCYILARTGDRPIHHFDKDGALVASFGPAPATPTEKRAYREWLRRGPDGSIYYRPEPELVFYKFAKDGSLLATIRPTAIPYRPRSRSNNPGDTIFGTDVLSDGRIIFEVVHRTPYVEAGRTVEGRAVSTASLNVKIYVVGPDGSVRVLTPPAAKIGEFGAVGPGDVLYFMKTTQTLRPGEVTTVQKVRANLK